MRQSPPVYPQRYTVLTATSYSYKYIEDSVRNKWLARLEDYRAGPSPQRPVGATYIPSRGIKVIYSMEDDQLLWDYVQQFEGKTGVAISGNKIYQDLAARVCLRWIAVWELKKEANVACAEP